MPEYKTNWRSSAAFVLFLAVLWIPLIGLFFGAGSYSATNENRNAAPLPTAGGAGFTAYFHDHFGFRRQLIAAQALFKIRVLGVSSSPDVVIGKQGWLFYSGEGSMDDGDPTLWIDLFERRRKSLSAHVLFVVAPDKQSIYPEFLPSSVRRVSSETPMDRFMQAVSLRPGMQVLDLRKPVLDAKAAGFQVFNRTDTHWNGRGVYAAYLAIAAAIPLTADPGTVYGYVYASGDMAKMLGLGGYWMERMETCIPARARSATSIGEHRKLVLIGDSFGAPLVPFLAQHFEATVALPAAGLDENAIAAGPRDLVIFEMVERKLNAPPPSR